MFPVVSPLRHILPRDRATLESMAVRQALGDPDGEAIALNGLLRKLARPAA